MVEDPDDEGRRLFLQIKNNLAPPQPGLAFRLNQREVAPGVIGSAVSWDENANITISADEALGGHNQQTTSTDDAVDVLQDLLARGELPVQEIERHAIEAGLLSEGKPIGQSKPFRLARKVLGIKPRRSGGIGGKGSWVWSLPDDTKVPSSSYDALSSDEGTLAIAGHLRDGGRP